MFKTELPKIKEGFSKVKNDMLFLSDKISQNYNEFISHHQELSKQIDSMSDELQNQINHIKSNLKHSPEEISSHELEKIKSDIKQLKEIVNDSHGEHLKVSTLVENLKQNKSDIKQLKQQTHSSELELFLLKEKLSQKDDEIKELKDISRKMFDIIDELSRAELDLINHQIKA